MAVAKRFETGTRTGDHRHERAQLLFAVSGLMVANTAEGAWLVPRGHALWMPAGLTHDVAMHAPVSMRTAYVRADAAAPLSPRCHVLRVSSLLEAALVALSEEAPVERTDRVDHLSWLILDEIARAPMTRLALPLPGEARLAALARALIADPGSVRTIDQWGEEMGMSRRTLTRRFRTQTGVSFGEWRRRLRLLSAAARVAEGQPLAKVVADLGYRNVAAFRAMARRHLGERFDELAGEA